MNTLVAAASSFLGGGGAAAIGAAMFRSSSIPRRLARFLDEWEGTPDQPGVVATLKDHDKRITVLEVKANGYHGSPTVDASGAGA